MTNFPIFFTQKSGLTFSDGKLTLNFDKNVHAVKMDDQGIFVDPKKLGNGADIILDEWTVLESNKSSGRTIIGVNRDVVPCVFTLSRRKVTNRSTVKDYATSDETKTVEDVMNEFNAVIDYYREKGQAVPDGLTHTSYTLKKGDFFQFRESARPFIAPKVNDVTWDCAIDDANRYEADPIKAFFYVTDVAYDDPNDSMYMTKLTLFCVWSTLDSYVVRQSYSANKS